jgi:hypothetical protein
MIEDMELLRLSVEGARLVAAQRAAAVKRAEVWPETAMATMDTLLLDLQRVLQAIEELTRARPP